MFTGYKTYICAAVVAVAAGAHFLGYINSDLYLTVIGLMGGGGLASLRSAQKPQVIYSGPIIDGGPTSSVFDGIKRSDAVGKVKGVN